MRPVAVVRAVLLAAGWLAGSATAAHAQALEARGFFDVGATVFTAQNSFDATFGSATGLIVGGGGGVVLPQNIFITVRASRVRKTGSRVVVQNGARFDLGIEDTVTITPLEVSGGYRFRGRRVRPYAGGGIGWYKYEETDPFATAAEATNERFTGYHLLGGAEGRLGRWLGVAGEAEWARVPNALGQQPSSVGTPLGESDLGGTTFRVKIIIGR